MEQKIKLSDRFLTHVEKRGKPALGVSSGPLERLVQGARNPVSLHTLWKTLEGCEYSAELICYKGIPTPVEDLALWHLDTLPKSFSTGLVDLYKRDGYLDRNHFNRLYMAAMEK